MNKRERYRKVIEWFELNMTVAESELNYKNPYELIVAVILSAQCTDKRVNIVTPKLLEQYPTAEHLANATAQDVFKLISSVNYPNSKSGHLVKMAAMLVEKFNSQVPSNIDDLKLLPGVGQKTANVVASIAFNKPVIAVDTHVYRISKRLGLSDKDSPLGVERDLTKGIPVGKRAKAHHWLILQGRYVCVARNPKCEKCGLKEYCLHYHVHCSAYL